MKGPTTHRYRKHLRELGLSTEARVLRAEHRRLNRKRERLGGSLPVEDLSMDDAVRRALKVLAWLDTEVGGLSDRQIGLVRAVARRVLS